MQRQPYIVLARKYRPTDFKDVVGQKPIITTLSRAIESGRLSHSLLFCGPRGVGKTTCARILAKKVNSLYQNTLDKFSNDFNIFELDAASNNSVDDIRSLIEQLRFAPQKGMYKIYIIDEVHMLSQAAFNAFLKTLEEPPAHAIFILATTEKHKVLPTILSRCQIYDFRRIPLEEIYKQLKKIAEVEDIKAEKEALHIIAQHADGALRDALSLFDRLISFSGKNLTSVQVREQLGILDWEYYFKIIELILVHDIKAVLLLFNEILQEGFDGRIFISGLANHLRNLMVASDPQSISLIEIPTTIRNRYIQQASYTSTNFLLNALQICQRAEIESKLSQNFRLSLEISLMQLASFDTTDTHNSKKKYNAFPSSKTSSNTTLNINNTSYTLKSEISSCKSIISHKSLPIKKIPELQKKETLLSSSNNIFTVNTQKKSPIESSSSSSSSNRSSSISFSIREALKEPVPTKSITIETSLAKEFYSKEDFRKAWEAFSKYKILPEKSSLRNVLNTIEYEFPKPNLVILYFPSKAALIEFSTIHESILNYLRHHLNNFHLYFEMHIKSFQREKIIYTPEEKFNFLIKKNPKLKQLKEVLSLDFYD